MKADITQEYLKSILHYDWKTGIFTWRKNGKIAGYIKKGNVNYIIIHIDYKNYYAHRLAFLYVTGSFPQNKVDHLNGNGVHNWMLNLRYADNTINARNQKMHNTNKSGITGIHLRNNNKWRATIYVDNKMIYLGEHESKQVAATIRAGAELWYGYYKNHGIRRSTL